MSEEDVMLILDCTDEVCPACGYRWPAYRAWTRCPICKTEFVRDKQPSKQNADPAYIRAKEVLASHSEPGNFMYRGVHIRRFTKEELIKIAAEGWKKYGKSLQERLKDVAKLEGRC